MHQRRQSDWRTRSFATTHGLDREGLTLYRQLLRLCRDMDSDIPLETIYPNFVIGPPLVDAVTPWEQIIPNGRGLGESDGDVFPEHARYDKDSQSITIPDRKSVV